MMRIKNLIKTLTIIVAATILFGCEQTNGGSPCPQFASEPPSWVSVSQGVWGCVDYWEGDFMPSTSSASGTKNTVVRTIHIYELTAQDDTVQTTSFYDSINTELIAVTTSDENGLFQIDLPEGRYSFFIEENGKFYASEGEQLDGVHYINVVDVELNKVTKKYINITYNATF